MRSRITILALLVTGLLMSGTGAGLAVSGLGQSENASSAQYNVPTPTPTPTSIQSLPCDRNGDGVVDGNEDMNGAAPGCEMDDGSRLPDSVQSEPTCDEDGNGVISPTEAAKNGCGDVASETDSDDAPRSDRTPAAAPDSDDTTPISREEAAQPARQVAASDDELPFTGFAAIPILVGGIALLSGGLVLRRRTV